MPAGKTILFTRPGGIPEKIAREASRLGWEMLHVPALEISPASDPGAPGDALGTLHRADILVFVSRNAVNYCQQLEPHLLEASKGSLVVAIGSGTRDELEQAGFGAVVCTLENRGSESLLALPELQEENVSGREIVIIRGQGGRELLATGLRQRGARVSYLEVYRRRKPGHSRTQMKALWSPRKPDAVVLSSAEGMHNLLELTPEEHIADFFGTPLVVMSPRLKKIAESQGFNAAIKVVMGYSDEEFILALKALFEARE